MTEQRVGGTGLRGLVAEVLGALRFEGSAYAGIVTRPTGLLEGTGIVLVGGLARGIGAFPQEGWHGVVLGVGVGVAVWLLAGFTIGCVGFALNRRTPRPSTLLAALGLAASPLVLLALVAWPPVAQVANFVAHGWATLSSILAVREAERVSTARAAWICVIALLLGMVLLAVIGAFVPPWNRPCLPGG